MNNASQLFSLRLNSKLKIIITSVLFCSFSWTHFAQAYKAVSYPVPSNKSNMLFYLQRSKDANTVVYELNYNKGILNEQQPVKAYWIKYAEDAAQKELSGIQRKFAFGIKSKKQDDGSFQLTLAGYDKIPLLLKRSATNTFRAHITLDRQEIILNRIYIHILAGGSFWSPNVAYIEFKGNCVKTGKSVVKQIKP